MSTIKPEKGICDACGKESNYTYVCCSACGATSYRYCLSCINNGIEPYSALVGMDLYYEQISDIFKTRILNPSLKFHNKTVEQFNTDVKKLDDEFIRWCSSCDSQTKNTDKF